MGVPDNITPEFGIPLAIFLWMVLAGIKYRDYVKMKKEDNS